MLEKMYTFFVSPFSGAIELISVSWKMQKHMWKHFRWGIVILVSFSIIGSVLSYSGQALIGILVNKLIEATTLKTITFASILGLFIALLVSLILPRILNVYRSFRELEDWRKMELFYEQTLSSKFASMDFALHDNPKVVDLSRKVRDNIFRVGRFYNGRPPSMIEGIITIAATLITLFTINIWYGIFLLFATIPELIVETQFGSVTYRIWGKTAELRRKRGTINSFFQSPESLTEIKLFSLTKHFIDKAAAFFWEFAHQEADAEKKKTKLSLLTTIIAQGGVVATAYFMLGDVLDGDLKIGTFAFVFGLILRFQNQLSNLFGMVARHQEDKNYIVDYFKFLDLENPIQISKNPIQIKSSTPVIRFENVSFKYPDTEKYVLKNINLEIRPGEKIAIVGVNGAGKSTLIKLLFRFYDPTEGRMLVDGIDLRDIDPNDWYKHLGSLFQKFTDYRLPLREAISVGDIFREQSDERLRNAIEKSETHTFIGDWKDGLDQQLGKQFTGGIEPSVGQWQKLALARVFYRDANIYVLDEPTSAIDAEAEANVFANLARLPEDKTVLFVSHRFSTIRQANRICVIEDGTISELGTHEELIKNAATYKRLFELQAKGYQ